jgi:hypothetical protein
MGKTVTAIIGIVAAVAIAVAAPYLAPGLLSLVGITGAAVTATALAIATAVISIGLSVAVMFAFKALGVGAPKAKDTVGPPQVFRQSISNSFIVYGKFRVGGLLVFYHAKQSGSDHYRYFVVAVAGHRCKQVVQWRLGDEIVSVDGSGAVTSGKYAGAAWLWFVRGTSTDAAHATFVAECDGKWTTAHQGKDVAKIYAKFKMTDAAVQAGMPNMTADIEGRDEILDPRDATEKYTNNGALIFYDFNQIPREEGGFGAFSDEIPDDAWISAQANVCDETVNSAPRYTINGVIQTGAPPADVRDALVVNLAGSYGYTGGKHLMRVGYWPGSSGTLSEDDLAGPIQVSPFMTSDAAATEVQGSFMDPSTGYQGAPFTTWDRPGATDVLQMDLDLAFTTNLDQANRIAAIMGKRAACEKTVVWPMNIVGLKARTMDIWQLGSTRYGLDNYAWLTTNWSFSFDPQAGPGVVFSLKEENAEIYDDGSPVTPSTPPTITQPSAPLTPTTDVQNLIVSSAMTGMTFSVGIPSGGNSAVTISSHTRVYSDKSVSVNSNGGPVSVAAASGDVILAYYDDPDRAGGAVTYQYLVLPAGVGDASSAFASPANPYRHNVFVKMVPASGGSTSGGSDAGSGGGGGGGRWELPDYN